MEKSDHDQLHLQSAKYATRGFKPEFSIEPNEKTASLVCPTVRHERRITKILIQ